MKYLLILSPEGKKSTQYELKGKRVGLGRGPGNHIRVDMDEVSSDHLEFRKQDDGGYELIDLKSKNGTRVNGEVVVEKQALDDSDRILIAETIPAFFAVVKEGSEAPGGVETGSDAENEKAGEFATLDSRLADGKAELEELESDIESKKEEVEKLEAKIQSMGTEIDGKETEVKQAVNSMESAAATLEDRKAEIAKTTEDLEKTDEIAALEEDLFVKTQRVKLLKVDLEERKKQMVKLQIDVEEAKNRPSLVPPKAPAPKPAFNVPKSTDGSGRKTMKLE